MNDKHLRRLIEGLFRLLFIIGPVLLLSYFPKEGLLFLSTLALGYAIGWGMEYVNKKD